MTLPSRTPGLSAAEAEERPLIARAAAGDTAAFRVLVERHQSRAYALAYRFVGTAHDAEEVAQDAFVKVWNALPGFRGESRFTTWLHRIVARCALDRLDVLRRRRARETVEEAAADVAADAPEADVLEARRIRELLERHLSAAQRAVVTLHYFEGRSVDDVARVLAMNENTVKTHLSRARAALRLVWPDASESA